MHSQVVCSNLIKIFKFPYHQRQNMVMSAMEILDCLILNPININGISDETDKYKVILKESNYRAWVINNLVWRLLVNTAQRNKDLFLALSIYYWQLFVRPEHHQPNLPTYHIYPPQDTSFLYHVRTRPGWPDCPCFRDN